MNNSNVPEPNTPNPQESIMRMDLEILLKTASEMNNTLSRRGTIPDTRYCKKTKKKRLEWMGVELSLCQRYTINLEAIIRRFEELDAGFKLTVIQDVVRRPFRRFLQVVRNGLPDFETQVPTMREFLEKFENSLNESRENIKTKGWRRISQCEKSVEASELDWKSGSNRGITRETKEKQYKTDRLKLGVMQNWVKMNDLMLEAFELIEGLKKWKKTVRDRINEFLKAMYWTAKIQGLEDPLKTKHVHVNEIREVLEEISFDWDSFLRKPNESSSTAPVHPLPEKRPIKEKVLEDAVEKKRQASRPNPPATVTKGTHRNKVTPTPGSTSVPIPNHAPLTQNFVDQLPQNLSKTPAVPVHHPNPPSPPAPSPNQQLAACLPCAPNHVMLPVWFPTIPDNYDMEQNIRQNTSHEVPHFNTHHNGNNQYMHQDTPAQLNMPLYNNNDRLKH